MKKVLIINSSARTRNSRSRKLTEIFAAHWKEIYINSRIIFRELGNTDIPHINEHWIAAALKSEVARSEQERLALSTSDTYIAELHNAEVIVIGAPMYNWSIPSTLKAYIDQVLRIGETFRVNAGDTQNPYLGLLENKVLFLLLSRGDEGYEKGGHNAHLDFQTNYLKTTFNIMGIRRIHIIALDGKSNNTAAGAAQNLKELIETELALTDLNR